MTQGLVSHHNTSSSELPRKRLIQVKTRGNEKLTLLDPCFAPNKHLEDPG